MGIKPMNIIQIYRLYPTQNDCLRHLEVVRWHGKPVCPYCQSDKVTTVAKEHRHHCNNCNTSFSVTVKTIFHNTKMDLQKWFLALSLILNAKKGLSARQLARDLEVNKNTAWFMAMRIRKAMLDDGKLLRGLVEMDETFIGGKPRKGGDKKGKPLKRGRGTSKIPVIGMVERGGNVKAQVSKKVNFKRLSQLVRRGVDCENSLLVTDEFRAYSPMYGIIDHKVVNHSYEYANGEIHTNTIEGFWALLKRGIVGQYHKVSVRYLQQYVNEFAFRFNNRKNENVFALTLLNAVGGAA